MKYTLEQRKERARALHKQGYNCSQCVVMVFEDVHGLSEDVAARASAGFGGGIGGHATSVWSRVGHGDARRSCEILASV